MAAAKRKASKKAAKKASRKPQDRAKRPKVSKAKPTAITPQDASGSVRSGFLNPFRVGKSYWAVTEGMLALGIGKMHPFAEIVPAIKKAMGDNWKMFAE